MTDYPELKRAAEAVLEHRKEWEPRRSTSDDERTAVLRYVHLAKPATILSLLDELATLRGKVQQNNASGTVKSDTME